MNLFLFWYGNDSKFIELKNYWENLFLSNNEIKIFFGPSDKDHQYLLNNFEYYKRSLEEKKYALMSDIWRLWKIYHNGGLYIDILTKINKDKIPELIVFLKNKNKSLFIKENKYYLNPFVFFCPNKNNKIISETLNRYKGYKNISSVLNIELIPLQITYSFKKNNIKIHSWDDDENTYFLFWSLNKVNPKNKNNYFYANFSSSWKKNKNDWNKTFRKYEQKKHKNVFVGIYMFLWWRANWILNIILFLTNWKFLKRNLSLAKKNNKCFYE